MGSAWDVMGRRVQLCDSCGTVSPSRSPPLWAFPSGHSGPSGSGHMASAGAGRSQQEVTKKVTNSGRKSSNSSPRLASFWHRGTDPEHAADSSLWHPSSCTPLLSCPLPLPHALEKPEARAGWNPLLNTSQPFPPASPSREAWCGLSWGKTQGSYRRFPHPCSRQVFYPQE